MPKRRFGEVGKYNKKIQLLLILSDEESDIKIWYNMRLCTVDTIIFSVCFNFVISITISSRKERVIRIRQEGNVLSLMIFLVHMDVGCV